MSTDNFKPGEQSAYDHPVGKHNARLTEVGRGTPAGELFRRFWQPIASSADATTRPREVRALGEDLILYRDKSGKAGLLYPYCAHRGTTLFYGRVEERGIRCCYHGWLFNAEGRCLEQPCEPQGGLHRDRIRQPWYPVEERYGMIFAYMGPLAKKPVLPRYEHLENLQEGEMLELDDQGPGTGCNLPVVPCNWLQHYENTMDPYHLPVLHVDFSVPHFSPELAAMPDVTWDQDDTGMRYTALRKVSNGRLFRRIIQMIPPVVRIPAATTSEPGPTKVVSFMLAVDDTHLRTFRVNKVRELGNLDRLRPSYAGKQWSELSATEHQDMPGDYEAQVGQGAIQRHSEENLASSDRGIAMLRRLISEQIEAVEAGRDPAGVIVDPSKALIRTHAGNYFEQLEAEKSA